jgi:hypothetical protein
MDYQKLLEYLKNFCECVESYLTKYDYAIKVISIEYEPAELGNLSSLIYGAHLKVLAFGANLTIELYYRDMTETGNIIQGTMDHVLNRRIGYDALRCEWPQWEAVLIRIIREG